MNFSLDFQRGQERTSHPQLQNFRNTLIHPHGVFQAYLGVFRSETREPVSFGGDSDARSGFLSLRLVSSETFPASLPVRGSLESSCDSCMACRGETLRIEVPFDDFRDFLAVEFLPPLSAGRNEEQGMRIFSHVSCGPDSSQNNGVGRRGVARFGPAQSRRVAASAMILSLI